ncbi:MAG TPA: glutamine amidotransferase, partial [Pirellulales bacterium]|nr:glutamine amidotransferase [Pirellulales bacterium]
IVLDDSLSMSLADSSGQSRYALAKAAAERLGQAVEGDLDGASLAVDRFDIAGKSLVVGFPDEPRVDRTDLAGAVHQAVAQLRSKPLVGVVLVSDGMDNTGVGEFQAWSETPVAVYTVGFQPDADASRLDLAVRGVQAPQRAIVHNEVKVDVLLAKTSGPDLVATVSIKRGREELASQKVPLVAGNVEQVVSIKLKPAEAGAFVYTASVSAEPGERMTANNARHFPLQVDADAIKVFYLEGFLRYEYKFLKNRLEDDPDVNLVSIVRRANPDLARSVSRTNTGASEGNLLTPERLKDFEVVVLGDMEGDFLSTAEYQAVAEWVHEGHGLVVLGGYRSFGPKGLRGTPLADVLPVVFKDADPMQSDDPFVLKLTETGRQHPIFEITGDRVKDAALWNTAPHLAGSCLVERAKAGADVLAVNPGFVADGQPTPVVALARYGSGHALVIGADTTWHWSRLTRLAGQTDTLFARFWSQTVRWLAGRQLKDERPPLVVSTNHPAYEVGKPVEIRAVRQAGTDSPLATAQVGVQIVNEAGEAVVVPVRAGSSEPDVFTGTWHPTTGGRYLVEAELSAEGATAANQSTEFLVHGSEVELAASGTDPERLRSIAKLTGGLYFDIPDSDRLAGKIERRQRRVTRVDRVEFWNSPGQQTGLFLFFLAAVTGEWVLRRRNHLM